MPRGRGRMGSTRRLTVWRRCVVRVLHDNTGLGPRCARVYEGGGATACARVCKPERVDDLHPLGPLTATVATLNRPSSRYRQPPTQSPPPHWKLCGNVGRSRSHPAAGTIRFPFCTAQSPSRHLTLAPTSSLRPRLSPWVCAIAYVIRATHQYRGVEPAVQ